MTLGEGLHEVVQRARRVAHPESRGDAAFAQPRREVHQRPADKLVAGRDARLSSGAQLSADRPDAQSQVDARLDNVPSVDHQHDRVAVALDDTAHALGDHLEDPRRVLGELGQAIAIELVAIHPEVDQRRRAEAPRELARDVRGMKIVDLGMQRRARGGASAAAVRGDQQNRRISLDRLQPGVRRFEADRRAAHDAATRAVRACRMNDAAK